MPTPAEIQSYSPHKFLMMWGSPVDFSIWNEQDPSEMVENIEFYSGKFWFAHRNHIFVEIFDEISDPNLDPLIMIPMEHNRILVSYVVFNDEKWLARHIEVSKI